MTTTTGIGGETVSEVSDATMTEYTPTTEQARRQYIAAVAYKPFAPGATPFDESIGGEFDRWLVAHDAVVAANALRAAADGIGDTVHNPRHYGDALRARADLIETKE